MLLIAATLLLVNLKLHWQQARATARFLVALFILLLPMLSHQYARPQQALQRIRSLGLEGFHSLPLPKQFALVASNYMTALTPEFRFTWEGTNNTGAELRHVIATRSLIPIGYLLPILVSVSLALRSRLA